MIKTRPTSLNAIQHFLLLVMLAFIAGLFVHNDLLWRWDNLLYDAKLSFWTRTASEDIIIIAIDDQSLHDLGKWPWPRSMHAQLINKLELESPKVIGFDIIFSESDMQNPLSDVLLARAMRASGKVVLPVFMSQRSNRSYPIENLPLPELTHHAAALGHVHIDTSADGIARRIFLRQGIDKPRWMHFGFAMLSVADDALALEAMYPATMAAEKYSPISWAREHSFLIPFAGPRNHFQQIGFSQVLSGHYPADLFRDKIVLVGVTAKGIADVMPTPVSDSMAGVEIIANVIDAALNDLRIMELPRSWLILLTAIFAVLPLLIYPYINPVSTLLVCCSIIAATLATAVMLLWLAGIWLPVSTILFFQLISYPLWSWRRLILAMRHINTELSRIAHQQKKLSVHRDRNIADEINFISQFVPIKGWVLLDEDGLQLMKGGAVPSYKIHHIKADGWSIDGYRYWARIRYQNKPCVLGLSIGVDAVIADEEMQFLDGLIEKPLTVENHSAVGIEDVLRSKIKQVQLASREYEELRGIVDSSLHAMLDGILICSNNGQVVLSNHRAGWYLYGDESAVINGQSLSKILTQVSLKNDEKWTLLLQCVLLKQQQIVAHAQHNNCELMVQISPLQISANIFDGFVITLTDISMLKVSEKKRSEMLDFLSHDLRSPLSSTIAIIELAKNKNSIDDIRTMLGEIESNTHKTLHLAEQFLQLSRANSSENIRFYNIDFNNVALNAIDQIWPLSNKMQVNIKHKFDHDELWTYAEPELLERAILNLLSNAIKHSQAAATVELNIQLTNELINCCVIDHGTGISMEELPHLFEMFRRTKDASVQRKHGIGLGLAFVDAVAKRHSGHVDVESKIAEGSSFCLRIPLVKTVKST